MVEGYKTIIGSQKRKFTVLVKPYRRNDGIFRLDYIERRA